MKIRLLKHKEIPKQLLEIPNPPEKLYIRGELPQTEKYLVVIGSRKYTNYGKEVTHHLIEGLRGLNITIISGLAFGIDGFAHEAAIATRLLTIAVPGSGLGDSVLYPRQHMQLAEKIIESGGCLLSEFESDFKATTWSFPQRNRIMAGLADAVLVIESEEKSGTRITAKLATDYNRDVLAVPGSIFSQSSSGTNSLLKLGATPICSQEDLIQALGFEKNKEPSLESMAAQCSPEEVEILELLYKEPLSRDELHIYVSMPIQKLNQILSLMEIKGLISEHLGKLSLSIRN